MNEIPLKPADFSSDQEVRWCPGCGDYAILKAVRSVLAELGRSPHEVVFVSGIGCAARFPYYMSTYGFHTIHGRAAAVATGVKLANPEIDVWVVGGDGDFMSIGANHVMHTLRRNVDLNMLLFNNAIYGLTKGQSSPTSPIGTRSPSTPGGSVDRPVNAALFALGSGARFVARTADTLQDHLPQVLLRAAGNRGASFVEIFQNCIVYNDGAFGPIADKSESADNTVRLIDGEPMIFGKDEDKGLVWDRAAGTFRLAQLGKGVREADLAVHDERNLSRATALAALEGTGLPMPLGVLYADPLPDYTAPLSDKTRPGKLTREDLKTILA